MTIFALSTGSVKSGIAIIRISGPNTKKILSKITKIELPKPRKANLCNFYNHENNELIDQGMLIWFPGPNSYTGADLAELHIHGSKAIIGTLLSSLSKIEDCRLAEPGEFTKIAFENGKINLLNVEALSDLISSETELQRRQAINLLSGKVSKKYLLSTIYLIRSLIIFIFISLPIQPITVLLFSASIGMLWLSTVPPTSGLVSQIFGIRYMGMLYGFVYLGHQLGSFSGVWFGGMIFDITGSYNLIWQIAIVLGLGSAILHLPIDDRPLNRLDKLVA